MNQSVATVLDQGFHGIKIEVECHISNGLPNILIVGFANKAVDESKERLRAAFTAAEINLPKKRITINLAPADVPKDSTAFDLAIAVSILTASKQIQLARVSEFLFIGELGLDGSIRAVRGIIGKLLCGKQLGYKKFIIPSANLAQASLIPGIDLYTFDSIRELYVALASSNPISSSKHQPLQAQGSVHTALNFDDIIGQERAKRAMMIVAAGGHNILLNGPPGTGKSMLAKALASILPPLSPNEMLEVTHLHSLALNQYDRIVSIRPFRAPHHTASNIAIVGGGHNLRPGDVSLSHRGVLFLDEFPEFKRDVVEALRQPLEDQNVTISRAKDSVTYPADFILVATANPCPCGYYGTTKACRCLPHEILRYQRKLSGPLMDRIDVHVDVTTVDHANLLAANAQTSTQNSAELAKQVIAARAVQEKRFNSSEKLNANMDNRDLKAFALLDSSAKSLLDRAATQLDISARSYMRTIKVARTIADLEDSRPITVPHISEALQYRSQKLIADPNSIS